MDITDVRITLRNDGKLKGFVTITLGGCYVVRGIKIIEGRKGLFLAMPSSKRLDGTFTDIVHPINRETRSELERVVLEKYRSMVSETGGDEPESAGTDPSRRPDPGPAGGGTASPHRQDGDDWEDQPCASPG